MDDDSISKGPRAVDILSRRRVFDGFFKVDEARLKVERFDGGMSGEIQRVSVERGEAAAALIYDADRDALLFVNQFRFPTLSHGPGWLMEVVAGMIDEDEAPAEAIRREAKEEANVDLNDVEMIARFFPSPGGLSERVHLFLANARFDALKPQSEDGEDLELVVLSVAEAAARLAKGEFEDAKTIIGLQHFLAREGRLA